MSKTYQLLIIEKLQEALNEQRKREDLADQEFKQATKEPGWGFTSKANQVHKEMGRTNGLLEAIEVVLHTRPEED